jgi:hypothetical protein
MVRVMGENQIRTDQRFDTLIELHGQTNLRLDRMIEFASRAHHGNRDEIADLDRRVSQLERKVG